MIGISAEELCIFIRGKYSLPIEEMVLNISESILLRDQRNCLGIFFQSIVQDLVNIHFQNAGFADFEFNAENDASVE